MAFKLTDSSVNCGPLPWNWSCSGRMFSLQFVKNSDTEFTSEMMRFSITWQTQADFSVLADQIACSFGAMFASVVFGPDYPREVSLARAW